MNTEEVVNFDSSLLKSATFDSQTNLLTISFQTGTVYGYEGVSQEVFEELKEASSAGNFFNSNIRDRYHYTRLE